MTKYVNVKKKQKQLMPLVTMMSVGASVGFAAATFGMKWAKSLSPSQLIIILFLIVPAFFLVVAVHEAGHAFAGSLVNFDFRMYVVWSVYVGQRKIRLEV